MRQTLFNMNRCPAPRPPNYYILYIIDYILYIITQDTPPGSGEFYQWGVVVTLERNWVNSAVIRGICELSSRVFHLQDSDYTFCNVFSVDDKPHQNSPSTVYVSPLSLK